MLQELEDNHRPAQVLACHSQNHQLRHISNTYPATTLSISFVQRINLLHNSPIPFQKLRHQNGASQIDIDRYRRRQRTRTTTPTLTLRPQLSRVRRFGWSTKHRLWRRDLGHTRETRDPSKRTGAIGTSTGCRTQGCDSHRKPTSHDGEAMLDSAAPSAR